MVSESGFVLLSLMQPVILQPWRDRPLARLKNRSEPHFFFFTDFVKLGNIGFNWPFFLRE